jgi:hypothetical protein
MVTFHRLGEVSGDHRVTLQVPPEVPVGKHDFVVTVAVRPDKAKRPRSSLADWAEQNAESWGGRLSSEDVAGFTGRRFQPQAVAPFRSRPDKEWGLTDCVSFALMRREGITQALSADVHFRQTGFEPMLLE